jgi:uncharacterized protein (TIGR03792 family)
MIIEWIRFKVAPDYREKFVQVDHEVWTAFLRQVPGFLHKDVWISLNDLSEVMLAIHWQTLAQQQAIPKATLQRVEAEFLNALDFPFQLLEIKLLQVRKSTHR